MMMMMDMVMIMRRKGFLITVLVMMIMTIVIDGDDVDLSRRTAAHLPRIRRHRVLAAVGTRPSYLQYYHIYM